jgi:hypothetical protein
MLTRGSESAGWSAALRALGVPLIGVRSESFASVEAFVAAARARALTPVCGLRAQPEGATLWLYRSRPGGHGELLEAALGSPPPDAGDASLVLALRLRLEMLSESLPGTGHFIPVQRPPAPAPLPPEAGLDFAPPPLTPWPERPAADLPTPVSERAAGGRPSSAYEVTVEAPGADAIRVEVPTFSPEARAPRAPWSMGVQAAAYGLAPLALQGAFGLVLRSPSLLDDHAVRVDLGWAPLAVLRDSVSLRGPWRLSADLTGCAPLVADVQGVLAGAVEAELGDTDHFPGSTTPLFRFGPRVGLASGWPAFGDSTFRLMASALWPTSGAPALGLQSTLAWPLF